MAEWTVLLVRDREVNGSNHGVGVDNYFCTHKEKFT